MKLTAIALNASLKKVGGEPSSTDRMIGVIAEALSTHDVALTETVRLADHEILPGVETDMGPGDAWPGILQRILAADILIFGTPIWLGQMSSIAKRVLERLDAVLSDTDAAGRYPTFGKVAVAAIVGNEDGGHAVSSQLFQALNDEGFTIPATAACYWTGEAMARTDFNELAQVPDKVAETARMLAANAAHLARLLKGETYPGLRPGG